MDEVADDIGKWIVNKMVSMRKSCAVVGLSRGVDSTLVAALAKRGIDKHNKEYDDNLKLLGLILPSKINANADMEDGCAVGAQLEIPTKIRNINRIVTAYYETITEEISPFDAGNMMSRIRANLLHTYAAMNNALVLGTGNRDEDYGLGYYTLFGDGAVHCSPIGDLPKSLVRELCAHVGFLWNSNREATAGLEEGQSDFKDLGYSYDFVDLCLSYGPGTGIEDQYTKFSQEILEVFEKDKMRYRNLFGEPKFEEIKDAHEDLLRRHNIAYHKSELLKPDICFVATTWDETPPV